jgi:hypothetical protein
MRRRAKACLLRSLLLESVNLQASALLQHVQQSEVHVAASVVCRSHRIAAAAQPGGPPRSPDKAFAPGSGTRTSLVKTFPHALAGFALITFEHQCFQKSHFSS